MSITPQQALNIFMKNFTSSQLGFSMLLTRMKVLYAKDPSTLQKCTDEINVFLAKYSIIMEKDYEAIVSL